MKELAIKGYNLDRFIDNLLTSGIAPKKMKRTQYDELTIQISDKEYKNLLVKKFASCYNIDVVRSRPRFSTLISIIERLGIVVGIAVSIFIMAISLNVISNINITVSGVNKDELRNQAQTVLAENNIVVGTRFDWSYKDLENLLISRLDNSSRVLVKRNGTQLNIDIAEIVAEPEKEHQNIVSSFDGKITEINYSSGNLKVNIGEGVVKGQVLIESGYVGDFFAEAKGEVWGEVVISGSAIGSTKQDEVKRTGRTSVLTELQILNKRLFSNSDDKFIELYENYEVESEEILISNNLVLPIKLIKYTIYELETIETIIEEDKLIEDLKNKAYTIAEKNLPEGAENKGITYDITSDNGFLKVICNIKTEILIGERK